MALVKVDPDGAMVEFHEALRLNPNLAEAHAGLGVTLGKKHDWDGAVAELREALRLNPNNETAHLGLGVALEQWANDQMMSTNS
jgi:Flp pilus assembly protein TadD